jgi:hypothetical protein
MKELDEHQLLSWRPRQPSAGLKRRLLRLAGADEVPTTRWLWSGVAPTMACALLTLMALNHDGSGLPSPLPVVLRLSNQDNAAFATGDAQTRENQLAAVTLDWTNGSVFKSSIRFTPTTNLTN